VNELPEDVASCADLLGAAADPSLHVARAALRRLTRLGGEREAAVLRERLLSVDLGLVPAYARALRALGDGGAAAVARRGLEDASPRVRIASALALRELADPRSAPALRAPGSDPVAGVRRSSVRALGRVEADAETETVCATTLRDRDGDVGAATVRALAEISAELDAGLGPALDDPVREVRREVAPLAARLDPRLIRRLAQDEDADVRSETLWALADSPREGLRDVFSAALEDGAWKVRRAAGRAPGALGDTAAVEDLPRALADSHATVRAAAARALQEILGERLAEELCAQLARADAAVRTAPVCRLAEHGGDHMAAGVMAHVPDPSGRSGALAPRRGHRRARCSRKGTQSDAGAP
jgi:HEAT repeat protein